MNGTAPNAKKEKGKAKQKELGLLVTTMLPTRSLRH
jgi:hypothetical protein